MNKGYTKIPNELLDKSDLSIQARYLLCVLLRHNSGTGKCFPTQATLGNEIGRSTKQVRVILNELIKAKALTKRQRGFNRSNDYFISEKYIVKNLPATTARNYTDQTKTYAQKKYKSSVHANADDLLNSKKEIVKDNNYFERLAELKGKIKTITDKGKGDERNTNIDSISDKEIEDKVYTQKTKKLESVREILESKLKSAEANNNSIPQHMIYEENQMVRCQENPTPTKNQQSNPETTDFSNVDSSEGVQE